MHNDEVQSVEWPGGSLLCRRHCDHVRVVDRLRVMVRRQGSVLKDLLISNCWVLCLLGRGDRESRVGSSFGRVQQRSSAVQVVEWSLVNGGVSI